MKDSPVFCVATSDGARLMLSEQQRKIVGGYMQRHRGQSVRMVLSQPTKGRSNNQNRYMWGVVYEYLAAETGHTTEEMHEWCKWKFLPRVPIVVKHPLPTSAPDDMKEEETVYIPKSTRSLSTIEMEEYLEHIRAFAASELNVNIPLPHESM